MVLGKLWGWIQTKPSLGDGPTRLPDYFPLEPRGCEVHAQRLFQCLANEATAKARDMEKVGIHRSYFDDVQVKPTDEKAAQKIKELVASQDQNSLDPSNDRLPSSTDNPLDECRDFIAYYKRCCDRELKKKKNWILTEPFRVQEEYRYKDQVK